MRKRVAMFSNIIYLELFIALFFMPGFFITIILGIKKFRFLLSFALSYSLLVLTLLPFEYYALPVARWFAWIQWEWITLAVLATARIFTYRNNGRGSLLRRLVQHSFLSEDGRKALGNEGWILAMFGSGGKPLPLYIRGFLNARLIVPLVLAGVTCCYLAYAGPYLEVPSDAWNHLFWFQWQKLNVIDNGAVLSGLSWGSLFLHHTGFRYFNPWYFIHAWLCHISGLPIMDSLLVLTFINVTVFLLGFYFFGLFIFAGLRINAFKKMVMAAFASLFAAATSSSFI